MDDNRVLVKEILNTINSYSREFKQIPSIDRTLANRYNQKLEDIQTWLGKTQWSQSQIDVQILDNVINTLISLNLLSKSIQAKDILTNG